MIVRLKGLEFFKAALLGAWSDFLLLFSAAGWKSIFKENQNKHYARSLLIAFLIVAVGLFIPMLQFREVGWVFIGFGGWFLLLFVNWFREDRKQASGGKDKNGNYKVPFDWRDIRFGSYGGTHGALVAYFLITALILSK